MAGAGYDAVIMRGAQRGQAAARPHGLPAIGCACQRHAADRPSSRLSLDGRDRFKREGLGVLLVNFSQNPVRHHRSLTRTSRETASSTWWCCARATAFDLIPAAMLAGPAWTADGDFPDRTDCAWRSIRAQQVASRRRPAHGGAVRRRGHAALSTPFSARILPGSHAPRTSPTKAIAQFAK